MKGTILHEEGTDYDAGVRDVDVSERVSIGHSKVVYRFELGVSENALNEFSEGDSATLLISDNGSEPMASPKVSCRRIRNPTVSEWRTGPFLLSNDIGEVLKADDEFPKNT